MTPLTFVVPGEPKAWERVRHNPKTGNFYNSARLKAAEEAVGWRCKEAASAGGVELPLAGQLEVLVIAASTRLDAVDLDNVVKLVLDGLTGVAWRDDKQVKAIGATLEDRAATAQTKVVIRPVGGENGG